MSDRFNTASGKTRLGNRDFGISEPRMTVSHRLRDVGLTAHSPAAKALISKKNQKSRLALDNEHGIWSDDEWSQVFVSDESKFYLLKISNSCRGRIKVLTSIPLRTCGK